MGRQSDACIGMIRKRFAKEKPLAGIKMSCCLHVTTETTNLVRTLKEGRADIVLCFNPLSTQDDVAASLVVDYGISVFAKRAKIGIHYKHLLAAIEHEPLMTGMLAAIWLGYCIKFWRCGKRK